MKRTNHLVQVVESKDGQLIFTPMKPKAPQSSVAPGGVQESEEADIAATSYDVIIVGTGQAGLAAAIAAWQQGAKVLVLESEATPGGTSLNSGGHFWFLNLQKTLQLATAIKQLNIPVRGQAYNNLPSGFDLENNAIRYMSSLMYRESYNEAYQYLGMPPNSYNFAKLFYENGAPIWETKYLPALDQLRQTYNTQTGSSDLQIVYDTDIHGVAAGFTVSESVNQIYTVTKDNVVAGSWGTIPGWGYPVNQAAAFQTLETDYWDESVMPFGSGCPGWEITIYYNNGAYGNGPDTGRTNISNTGAWLTDPFKHFQQVVGPFQLNSRVIDFKETLSGVVLTVSVNATGASPTTVKYKANKGVVFASGGFSRNPHLLEDNYLTADERAACSGSGSRGDFVSMSQENGLDVVHLKDGFMNQQTLTSTGTPNGTPAWFNWFTAHMTINAFGNRVYAETAKYNERAKHQLMWNPTLGYTDRFLFLVVDRNEYNLRIGDTFPNSMAFSVENDSIPIATKIQTICSQIASFFASLPDLANFVINPTQMATGFLNTLNTYHSYCATGIDLQFQRQNNDSARNFLGYIRQAYNPGFNKDSPVTEAADWRWNPVNVAALYGPTIQSYFATIPTMPYTYPDGHTYNVCPDILMQPILDPVVTVLIPAVLDTKGGPMADANQKVIGTKGLFAAGNCGGYTVMNTGYFGAGATLAPCVYTGWTAGTNAANNNYIFNQDNQYADNMQLLTLMGNQFPVRSLTLTFSNPMPLVIAVDGVPANCNAQALFKLSVSPNESIPYGTNVTGQPGWTAVTLVRTGGSDNLTYYQITLPGNTFTLAGTYFLTIQLYDATNLSFGPPYALQEVLKIVQAVTTSNEHYVENVPAGSLQLTHEGAGWSGKHRAQTASGFIEASNNQNIYLNFKKLDHNFHIVYGFEFGNLAQAQTFANFVYPNGAPAREGLDAEAAISSASESFNFTVDPNAPAGVLPNILYVAYSGNERIKGAYERTYQRWFVDHYDPAANGHKFPRESMANCGTSYYRSDD